MMFRIAINVIAVVTTFGSWQQSIQAGVFMLVFAGFMLTCCDIIQGKR